VRCLLIDIEGTVVPRETWKISRSAFRWLGEAKKSGIKICLISNSVRVKRVEELSSELDLPFVPLAFKPLPFSFIRAMKMLGGSRSDTAVIGDQLFMDILGGNLLGLHTIMVPSITPEKKLGRRFMRWLEGFFFTPER